MDEDQFVQQWEAWEIGTCDCCLRPFGRQRPLWYHCTQRVNYDECDECYQHKTRHMHYSSMSPRTWRLFAERGEERGEERGKHFPPSDDELDLFAKHFVRKFDLIIGTSIGGIIALMLCLDVPLSEIKRTFPEKVAKIFPSSWLGPVAHLGLL